MMYTIRIRLIAYTLLINHSLMSCYNPDMGAGHKQLTEKAQQEKQQEVLLSTPEQEECQQATLPTFEEPIPLSIHTATHHEGDTIAEEPTSSIKTNKLSPLSGTIQQVNPSLRGATTFILHRHCEPRRGVAIQKSLLSCRSIEEKALIHPQIIEDKQTVPFFHPLHPIFTNKQGCQIQFISSDLQGARVQDIHERIFHLQVFKEDASLQLQDLMAKGEEWWKYHMDVVFPEQDIHCQGHLRIHNGWLQGGMPSKKKTKGNSKEETTEEGEEENPYIANKDLLGAAAEGDLEAVRYFIEREQFDPNTKDEYDFSPVLLATMTGQLSVVQYLIESSGVSPTCTDKFGNPLLHVAIQGNHLPVVKYLIKKAHVNPERKNYHEQSPLQYAVDCGYLDIIKYLIEEMRADKLIVCAGQRTDQEG